MYSTVSTRLTHEEAKKLAFGSVQTYFVPVGNKIEYPARQILYQNMTDTVIWVSLDGIHDGLALRANQDFIQDITVNQVQQRGVFVPVGDYIYVRADVLSTSGLISVTVFYGQD